MFFSPRKVSKFLLPCTNHVTTWAPAFCALFWYDSCDQIKHKMLVLQQYCDCSKVIKFDKFVILRWEVTVKWIWRPYLISITLTSLDCIIYRFLAKLLFKKSFWVGCNQILFTAGKQIERYFSCLEIQEKTSKCRKPKFKICYINWVDALCTLLIKESTETYSSWL
jgi:hypothetical protein